MHRFVVVGVGVVLVGLSALTLLSIAHGAGRFGQFARAPDTSFGVPNNRHATVALIARHTGLGRGHATAA